MAKYVIGLIALVVVCVFALRMYAVKQLGDVAKVEAAKDKPE